MPMAIAADNITYDKLLKRELLRAESQHNYLAFQEYTWRKSNPLIIGSHTRAIADRLDRAIEDYFNGISTNLLIQVPFRHGKSDQVSRRLAPYFLGRCHMRGLEPDVMLSGYGDNHVRKFSRYCRTIINSHEYNDVFPGVKLKHGANSTQNWMIEGSSGEVTAGGLIGGQLTGAGFDLGVCDDYCKSREEAESETYRNKAWYAFTDNFITRTAPVYILIVCATPWHHDDISCRITNEMEQNADFPQFEILNFPARNEDGSFLFPERFSENWYREKYASLGPYSAAGLLDCNPKVRGTQTFYNEMFRHYPAPNLPDVPKSARWFIMADYAGGETAEACESSILTFAIDPDGFYYLDHLQNQRVRPSRLKQLIIDEVQRVNPQALGLEKGCAMVLRDWIMEDFQKSGIKCPIKEIYLPPGSGSPKPGVAKKRIEKLEPLYLAGKVFHNIRLRGGPLERQLIAHPSKPDDAADCFAMALGLGNKPKKQKRKKPFSEMTIREKQMAMLKARAHTRRRQRIA